MPDRTIVTIIWCQILNSGPVTSGEAGVLGCGEWGRQMWEEGPCQNHFKELMFSSWFQQATFQIKPCLLQEHFHGYRGLSVMPTTLASVIRLPVRLPVWLETLTSPCKYQIRQLILILPFLESFAWEIWRMNEGGMPPGFKTVGFKSNCDYVAQSCLSESMPLGDTASSPHLIYSLQTFTVPLNWPVLGAWVTALEGLGSPAA